MLKWRDVFDETAPQTKGTRFISMLDNIFISYRRDDSGGHAGRILDRLTSEFGHERLFFDVDNIPLGTNFAKVLREEVAKCGVLLAMIGPNWLNERNESGKRRLLDPNDFVRIEIAAALQRDIPVIPVLLDGAQVPKSNRLPDELKELGSRNGIEIRHASFHSDMDRLIRGLKGQSNPLGTPQIAAIAKVAPAKSETSDSSRIKHASSIPFPTDKTVVEESAHPEPARWWLRFLYIFRIKYIALALGIILISAIFYRSASLLRQPISLVEGAWKISMTCPSGARLTEPYAEFSEGQYGREFPADDGSVGTTELVMRYEDNSGVDLSGRVTFGKSKVYQVAVKGLRQGNVYVGEGRFGSESNCALRAEPS